MGFGGLSNLTLATDWFVCGVLAAAFRGTSFPIIKQAPPGGLRSAAKHHWPVVII